MMSTAPKSLPQSDDYIPPQSVDPFWGSIDADLDQLNIKRREMTDTFASLWGDYFDMNASRKRKLSACLALETAQIEKLCGQLQELAAQTRVVARDANQKIARFIQIERTRNVKDSDS